MKGKTEIEDIQKRNEDLQTLMRVRDEHAAAGGSRFTVTLQVTFMCARHAVSTRDQVPAATMTSPPCAGK